MIDLDQARAARNEARDRHPQMLFEGKVFELPVEMPIEVARHVSLLAAASKKKDGDKITTAFVDIIKVLLRKDYESFMELGPSIEDMSAIIEGIAAEYGVTQGESPASAES